MNFINDKTTGLKSLAVWFPTVLAIIVAVVNTLTESQVVPVEWIPFLVFISGFLGRIIKQPSIKE